MRILQVSPRDTVGGAERIAWNLFQALRQRGYASYLAAGMRRSDDPHVLEIPNDAQRNLWAHAWGKIGLSLTKRGHASASVAYRLAVLGEPQRCLDYLRGIEDYNFSATARLLDLPPAQPDIVHAHNLHGYYFDLRMLPDLSHRVPVVLTLHDAWLLSGHCAHSFGCERWRTGCGHCPDLSIYPAVRRDATAYNWRRKRDIYMNSRLYVATPSRWLMDKVQASMMQSAVVDSRVIPNGVDLSVFCPGDKQFARHALGLSQSAHVALFVGYGAHNNPWKDYATMESAIMRLATRIDEREIVFVCLGGQGADKRVGSASIRFVNAERDPHNVAQFYRAADIYLHAARADTFPTVILEALACGTPVVATAVGGIPEQIEQGNTGFVVPPGDATAMADCTEKLLGDKPRQQYMSAQAATLARHRFDLKRMVEEYIDWYQEILQGEGSRA